MRANAASQYLVVIETGGQAQREQNTCWLGVEQHILWEYVRRHN